ncbi:MAG: hypothetical protein KBS62_00320 [Oscillospiraceae bacterium]|nr:hypothetical protein [Candidatus Ruminococcus equi]
MTKTMVNVNDPEYVSKKYGLCPYCGNAICEGEEFIEIDNNVYHSNCFEDSIHSKSAEQLCGLFDLKIERAGDIEYEPEYYPE